MYWVFSMTQVHEVGLLVDASVKVTRSPTLGSSGDQVKFATGGARSATVMVLETVFGPFTLFQVVSVTV
ncbi:hypothetical protein DSECCO2_426140 [anaerobic digester metagenome]